MSTEIMVIIIVAIVVSGVVRLARIAKGTDRLPRHHRRKDGQALLDPAQPSPRELELQREVEDLRERIHVLERIATDQHQPQRLAAEIESLRER
jgi:Sec-independent protein translocase protein TatA